MKLITAAKPDLSIREFAESIDSNRTTVRDAMKALNLSGNPQGKGKPTLLSQSDQSALARYIKPELSRAIVTHAQVSVVPSESSDSLVNSDSIAPARYEVEDNSQALETTEADVLKAFGQFFNNSQGFESAFLQMADLQGSSLGVQYVARKYQAASNKANELEQQMGKQVGLVASDTHASGTSQVPA